jgi:hypothetical protein
MSSQRGRNLFASNPKRTGPARPRGMFRYNAFILTLVATGVAFAPSATAEGSWTFQEDQNQHLVYADGGKAIFSLGCAKYIGFTVFSPRERRKRGTLRVRLSNQNASFVFAGALIPSDDGHVDTVVVLDKVTYKPVERVMSILTSGLPIEVSTPSSHYHIAAPTIEHLKRRFLSACW